MRRQVIDRLTAVFRDACEKRVTGRRPKQRTWYSRAATRWVYDRDLAGAVAGALDAEMQAMAERTAVVSGDGSRFVRQCGPELNVEEEPGRIRFWTRADEAIERGRSTEEGV